MSEASTFAERLGLPIRNLQLLEQALTHSSWVHEHPEPEREHNERLELLGDAVVNLAIAAALHARYPREDEGALSARRAIIVSAAGLSTLAERIDLGPQLHLGAGEARSGGRRRPLLLASALEAVAGAVFLDLGWEAARQWIVELARPELERDLPSGALKSPKSRLQELTQQSGLGRPTYELVGVHGPDHQRSFDVAVSVDGRHLARGAGSSRRRAESAAAELAVVVLQGAREPAAGAGPSAPPGPLPDAEASQ